MDRYFCTSCNDVQQKFHHFQDSLTSFYERSKYYLLLFSKHKAQTHLNIWFSLSAVRMKRSEENSKTTGLMLVKLGQCSLRKRWKRMQQNSLYKTVGREKQTPKPIN